MLSWRCAALKVLLVNPPTYLGRLYVREGRCQHPSRESFNLLLPQISLAYVASVLENEGFNVELWDCQVLNIDPKNFLEMVAKSSPDLIVMNTAVTTIDSDMKLADEIKGILPDAVVSAIGAHVTATHDLTIKDSHFDIIVRGEPEMTILELANALRNDNNYQQIAGTTTKQRDRIFINPTRPIIENLDTLPFPARHLLHNEKYIHPLTKRTFTVIQHSRGCPYQCIYCVAPLYYGHKFRCRSVNNVLTELEEVIGKYGIRDIYFFAETATLNKKFMRQLSQALIARKLNINWWSNARVDSVDLEILQLMKKSGCSLLAFGVESGVQEILDKAKKGIRLNQTIRTFRLCQKVGIETNAFVIFGLPGETKETMRRTLNFVKKLNPDYVEFFPAIPFPGTELCEILKNQGLIVSDELSLYDGYLGCVVRTQDMTDKELSRFIKNAYYSFYLRPQYIIRKLFKAKNVSELARLGNLSMRFLLARYRQ